jgi:hypothetical protein
MSSAGRQVGDSVKTTSCRSGRAAWCFDAFVPSFTPKGDIPENDGEFIIEMGEKGGALKLVEGKLGERSRGSVYRRWVGS